MKVGSTGGPEVPSTVTETSSTTPPAETLGAKPVASEAITNPELPNATTTAPAGAPLPPPGTEQGMPEGAQSILALEPLLGTPNGEKVGDAFAHSWIEDLAKK